MDRDGSGWLDPKKLQKALQFMYAEATHNTPQAQCDTVASSRERERERERASEREVARGLCSKADGLHIHALIDSVLNIVLSTFCAALCYSGVYT